MTVAWTNWLKEMKVGVVLDFIVDKFFRFILLFESSFKKHNNYIYQRDFIGKDDYWKGLAEMFKPVTDIIGDDLEMIYNIKHSLYNEPVLDRIKYCIENKMWGLFAFTLSDGYRMSNEEYFNQSSLMVYLVIRGNKEKTLVVVKSTVKHLEVLVSYPKIDVRLSNFKDRKMIYSRETNFTSL